MDIRIITNIKTERGHLKVYILVSVYRPRFHSLENLFDHYAYTDFHA